MAFIILKSLCENPIASDQPASFGLLRWVWFEDKSPAAAAAATATTAAAAAATTAAAAWIQRSSDSEGRRW